MCGIIGYVGNKKVTDVLINGLKSLEYRGYDSSGIAYKEKDKIKIIKSVGRVDDLVKKIDKTKIDESFLGIGHTRWATHGAVNEKNCHPHTSNSITLVHNGIVENYRELKLELEQKGYKFTSETDTEVVCALIDSLNNGDMISALEQAKEKMIGSYALLIMNKDIDYLYAIRKNSPLIIGVGENENFVASDISAILNYTKKYIEIAEEDIFMISNNDIKLFKKGVLAKPKIQIATWNLEDAQKQGYEHFMLKEIYEQEDLIDKIINKFIDDKTYTEDIPSLVKYKRIDIVACGSAYHAGLVGKYLMDKYLQNSAFVSIDVASEYRYKTHYYNNDTLLIVISQSGETADTLACLRMAKEHNVDTLAIVNVPSSSIAKESKFVMPMLAGPEIAVATTKGYFSQVLNFSLLIQKLLIEKNILTISKKKELILELKKLSKKLDNLINQNYKKVAKKIYNKNDIYFIGRGLDYITLLEASLKLKEISYIHSDTYQAGELKHGPIALIEEATPVLVLITDKNIKDKTISNAIEAKSRGAKIILIVTEDLEIDENLYEDIIRIPLATDFYQTLYSIIPFQMIAYEVAKLRKCDIDKPKNLAKSVTVE